MKIGAFASIVTPICTPELIKDLGVSAESSGLDSLWLGEHVVLFDEMEVGYPGTPDGKLPIPEGSGLPDTVVTFSFLASVTKTIRFGTGVSLIPQRNLIYSANEFATLDYLSNGRFDLGVGVGWCKEELVACGFDFTTRGSRCDEMLEAMIRLWTEREVTYHGEHINLESVIMDPKPVQQPHIPLLIGGYSEAAMQRTARFGQGWIGFGADAKQTAGALQQLDRALKRENRSRNDLDIVVMPPSVDLNNVNEYQDIGVDRLIPMITASSTESVKRRVDEISLLIDKVS
tara:strand:- start:891 stop:1754 length:864 start_codon:yes stop_codon:yes gene_type:complete